MSTQPLQPFHLPLNATNLIEASAGTGKTYTIATLYIRLLLQIGEGYYQNLIHSQRLI